MQCGPKRGQDRLHIAVFGIRRPEQEQPNFILESSSRRYSDLSNSPFNAQRNVFSISSRRVR